MKTLTALQKRAVEYVETQIDDLWRDILELAKHPHDEKDRIVYLANMWKRINQYMHDIATELDCRCAIDLGPRDNLSSTGLTRVYILDNEKTTVKYNGEVVMIGNANWKLTAWLEEDFKEALDDLINGFDNVLKEENDDKIDDLVDDIMLSMIQMQTTNDFIAGRFGDCDTGIVLYQNQSDGKINVSIYDGIGERVPLQL